MRFSLGADVQRANLKREAMVDMTEFIGGLPIMVAMRAAIRPGL